MDVEEIRIQRERYSKIAAQYEQIHHDPEHVVAMSFMEGMLGYLDADSVLDVGAGTGRTMLFLKRVRPALRIRGIEPVAELRQVGHQHGLPPSDLTDGDGYSLPFAEGEFDVVCEFGMLHHVRAPNRVVAEMLRVARKAVFISDANNFGGGSRPSRLVKQFFHACRLWPLVNYVKTAGKGYSITAGDGLFYSYSVFDSVPLLRSQCRTIHMLNTASAGANLYRTAHHLAILGVKHQGVQQ